MFYREVRSISKCHVGVFKSKYKICSRQEVLLKLALNTNQSINQSMLIKQDLNPIDPVSIICTKLNHKIFKCEGWHFTYM